jgi:hypothetical protein
MKIKKLTGDGKKTENILCFVLILFGHLKKIDD